MCREEFIKRKKEEDMLDMQDVDIGDETEKDKSKIDKSLKSWQEKIKRNRCFKHLKNHSGKGHKNRLRRLEAQEEDKVITVHNKKEI